MSMSSREGRKRLIDAFDEISNKKQHTFSAAGPLCTVVACLTGLSAEKKTSLHGMIESLGGSFTREFNLDKDTHLIAETAQGAKFDLAVSNRNIRIVTPLWLSACSKAGKRVDETPYLLDGSTKATKLQPPSTLSQLERLLADYVVENRSIFELHHFYLLGFEEDIELKQKLGKLIRRGKGTIHWEMNESISIMILHDTCEESLRKAAQIVTTYHPLMPPAVSPRWVMKSWIQRFLAVPSQYPPIKAAPAPKTMSSIPSKPPLSRNNSATSVFRGCLFSLVRIAPPAWAMDFDTKQQESFIKSHGGKLLTLKLMDAIRADAKNGAQRKKCYVVCWGGRPHLQLNPILSQVQQRHDICDLVLVTPMWLQTCVTYQKRIRAEGCPLAFTPQQWPLRKLESTICISLTGFQATEKAGLIQLIKAIGGTYNDEMKKSNTHLICVEKASGLKLEKAIVWGLHIVSVDWLHHVIEHGIGGKENSKGGCESQFTVRDN